MSSRRGAYMPATRPSSTGRWVAGSIAVVVITVILALVAEQTPHGRSIVSGVDEFLLKYMGVFALIGLTTAVGVGLVATDRIVMRPGHRVVAQAVHRGVSLAALTSLVAHIVLEIVAHRSHVIDSVVPFLAQNRTLYVGLGTVASDLVVLIVITGFARGRFAGNHPGAWRAIHAVAYLAWPLSIIHGLMAGRTAKPYVDWSYGACVALVALALGIRFAATVRADEEKLAHPVADRVSVPTEGLVPGARVSMTPLSGSGAGGIGGAGALGGARPGLRALPAGSGSARNSGAMAGLGATTGSTTGSMPRVSAQEPDPAYLNAQQMAPDQLAQQQAAQQRMAQQRMAAQPTAYQQASTPPMGTPQMPAQHIAAQHIAAPQMPAPQMPAPQMPAPQMPAPQMPAPQMPAPHMAAPQPYGQAAQPYGQAPQAYGQAAQEPYGQAHQPYGQAQQPYLQAPQMAAQHLGGPPIAPAGQWQQRDPGLQMDSTDPLGWPAPPEWSDTRGWTGTPDGAQR